MQHCSARVSGRAIAVTPNTTFNLLETTSRRQQAWPLATSNSLFPTVCSSSLVRMGGMGRTFDSKWTGTGLGIRRNLEPLPPSPTNHDVVIRFRSSSCGMYSISDRYKKLKTIVSGEWVLCVQVKTRIKGLFHCMCKCGWQKWREVSAGLQLGNFHNQKSVHVFSFITVLCIILQFRFLTDKSWTLLDTHS